MPAREFIQSTLKSIACLLALLLISGCGASYDAARPTSNAASEEMDYQANAESGPSGTEAPAAQNGLETLAAVAPAAANRKIIYTSSVRLVVEDYKSFESELPKLVSKHGGFVASSETDRRYRDNQSGQWVVRIPIDQYSDFLSGVDALGFAESRSENAQDVTEEYVDTEVRIENKKKLESRILTMLEERAGKLSDVLEIERELARVREEIERMEGRLRFLKDRTSLATITIHCREEKEYVPPEPPTLLSRITLSWTDSLSSLRYTGENFLVGAIAAVPWLVVLAIPVLIVRYLIKRWWRKRRERKLTA
jgi:hypothetical protein